MSVRKFYSPSALKAELEVVRQKVSLQETMTSWYKIEAGIVQLTECCRSGGSAFATEMVAGICSLSKPLNNAINSERIKLSCSAIELVIALSVGLGPTFEPLVSLFVPTLLGLCARTNTVFTRRAKACIFAVIENTRSPSLLPYLTKSVNHKSATLRSVAAKGVLLCLNCFHSLDDTRLIDDVIKLTAQDARADVRKTGEKIFDVYKALLPDCAESLISISPVTKKYSAVQCIIASRSTSQVLSCSRPKTGKARPLQAQKITSGTHSERRSHPLGSELRRDIPAVMPIPVSNHATSARQDALCPPSEPGSLSEQSTNQRRDVVRPLVPTTQGPRRIVKDTIDSRSMTQVRSRCRPTTGRVRSVGSLQAHKNGSGKHTERRARPLSSTVPQDTISTVRPIVSKQATSACKNALRPPSELGPSTAQSTKQRRVIESPLVHTTQSSRAGNMVEGRVKGGTGTVLIPTAPLRKIDGTGTARTRVRRTRPLSVKPSAVSSSQKLSIPNCDPKHNHITTEVKLHSSQDSRRRVTTSRSSQEAVNQTNPGRCPVTKGPKPSFKALMKALLEDIPLPPSQAVTAIYPTAVLSPICRSRLFERDVTIDDMLVFQDISHHSFAGCRRSPSRQRRQDSRTKTLLVDFFTSTPRRSRLPPLSPLRSHGTKVIPHAHNPNISCFQGCELREALERSDIELDHATMLYI